MWYVRMGGWMVLLGLLWLLAIAGFAGIGRLIWRVGGWRGAWHDAVWTGVVASVAGLQIWHLFAPVDSVALAAWSLAAVVGWGLGTGGCRGGQQVRKLVRLGAEAWRDVTGGRALLAGALLLGLMWFLFRLANDAIAYTPLVDAYHFTALNWNAHARIVPGLGNLEGRLAFNNSSLLLHALVDVQVGQDRLWGVLHGAMALTLIGASFHELFRMLRRPARASVVRLVRVLLLVPLMLISVLHRQMYGMNGVSPDASLILVQLAALPPLMLFFRTAGRRRRVAVSALMLAAGLLATGITFKLSSLVFSVLILIACLGVLAHRERSGWRKPAMAAAALAALLLVPYFLRGMILSGYPMYPSTWLGVNVDWRVPKDKARWEKQAVDEWSRFGDRVARYQGEPWFEIWLHRVALRDRLGLVLPSVLACLALLGMLRGVGRAPRFHGAAAAAFGAASIAALAAWLILGPAPRFIFGVLYSLALSLSALSLATRSFREQRVVVIGLIAGMWLVAHGERYDMEVAKRGPSRAALQRVWLMPPPNLTGRYVFPEPHLIPRVLPSGLIVYHLGSPHASRAPLLTQTREEPWLAQLRLRRPNEVHNGFICGLD